MQGVTGHQLSSRDALSVNAGICHVATSLRSLQHRLNDLARGNGPGLNSGRELERAFQVFFEMQWQGVIPDVIGYSILISSYDKSL